MVQQPTGTEEALSYIQYQGRKDIDSLVALMQRTAADWQRTLEGMNEEQASFAPAGEWNTKEVATHYAETTRSANRHIARLTETGDAGALDAQHADKPDSTPSVEDLRTEIAQVFDEMVSLTRKLEGNAHLAKRFPHPFFGELNILEWIAFQRVHSMDHMQQIDKNKAAAGYPNA